MSTPLAWWMREVLHHWPTGVMAPSTALYRCEVDTLLRLPEEVVKQVRHAKGSSVGKQLKKAEEYGYLVAHPPLIGSPTTFERTSKLMACPKRRSKQVGRPRSSRWPWTLRHHRDLVQANPLHAYRNVLDQLRGDRRGVWDIESGIEFPLTDLLVRRQVALCDARKALDYVFSEGTTALPYYGSAMELRLLALSGHTIAMLLAYLMVRPVFENDRFVRFDPLTYQETETEMKRLDMFEGSPQERWRKYNHTIQGG